MNEAVMPRTTNTRNNTVVDGKNAQEFGKEEPAVHDKEEENDDDVESPSFNSPNQSHGDIEDDIESHSSRHPEPLPWLSRTLESASCILKTLDQRDTGWFLCWLFSFTSTSAHSALKQLMRDKLSPEQVSLVENDLGIRLVDDDDNKNDDDYLLHKNKSTTELKKLCNDKLKKMCRAYKVKGYSNMKRTNWWKQ